MKADGTEAVPLSQHATDQIQRRYNAANLGLDKHTDSVCAINLNLWFIIYIVKNINRLPNLIKGACDMGVLNLLSTS